MGPPLRDSLIKPTSALKRQAFVADDTLGMRTPRPRSSFAGQAAHVAHLVNRLSVVVGLGGFQAHGLAANAAKQDRTNVRWSVRLNALILPNGHNLSHLPHWDLLIVGRFAHRVHSLPCKN